MHEPQPSRTGSGASSTSTASVTSVPMETNEPRPGAIAIVFRAENVSPARRAPSRSTWWLASTNTAARAPDSRSVSRTRPSEARRRAYGSAQA